MYSAVLSKIIFNAAVIGNATIILEIPQSIEKTTSDNMAIKTLVLTLEPVILGVINYYKAKYGNNRGILMTVFFS